SREAASAERLFDERLLKEQCRGDHGDHDEGDGEFDKNTQQPSVKGGTSNRPALFQRSPLPDLAGHRAQERSEGREKDRGEERPNDGNRQADNRPTDTAHHRTNKRE